MLVIYLALFFSLFFGLSIKRDGFYEGCLDRKQTDAVKGFFIWMVFIRHSLQTVHAAGFVPESALDLAGFRCSADFYQLVVVMFLFYSGYGVMEAIIKKGKDYLDHFPRRRVLNTLLNFDVAVLCFIALNLLMGVHLEAKQIGWSLIAWQSLGNSNWYIFVILFCYMASWICGKVFLKRGWRIAAMTTLLVLAGEAALSFLRHGQPWWYNTMLCYPAGMFLSLYKDKVISFVKRYYWVVLVLLLALFMFLHLQRWIPALRGLTYNAKSIVFAGLVVLMTMKVKTGNRFLYWSGACVFPLYIYQRLPMLALRHWAGDVWVSANPILSIFIFAVVVVCIALSNKYWQIKLR